MLMSREVRRCGTSFTRSPVGGVASRAIKASSCRLATKRKPTHELILLKLISFIIHAPLMIIMIMQHAWGLLSDDHHDSAADQVQD
jgi:hypothetical protein